MRPDGLGRILKFKGTEPEKQAERVKSLEVWRWFDARGNTLYLLDITIFFALYLQEKGAEKPRLIAEIPVPNARALVEAIQGRLAGTWDTLGPLEGA